MSPSQNDRYRSAYDQWQALQQAQQEQPREAPDGLFASPRNFLAKDDPRRGTSQVIPAGQSQFAAVEDPWPDRISAHDRRLAAAAVARAAAAATQLSGSSSVRDRKAEMQAGWHSELVRVAGGRIETRWVRDVDPRWSRDDGDRTEIV